MSNITSSTPNIIRIGKKIPGLSAPGKKEADCLRIINQKKIDFNLPQCSGIDDVLRILEARKQNVPDNSSWSVIAKAIENKLDTIA